MEGIVTSVVLFYVPYAAFYNAIRSDGEEIVSHHAFGCTVASILIVTVTLRVSNHKGKMGGRWGELERDYSGVGCMIYLWKFLKFLILKM